MSLGTPEMIVIFVLILLLFGPNRLPELARGLGKGMREFRKVTSEFQNQLSALGEHDEEPRRARNEPRQDDSDYRTAPYDSNKLDTTYNDHEDYHGMDNGHDVRPAVDSHPVADASTASSPEHEITPAATNPPAAFGTTQSGATDQNGTLPLSEDKSRT